jgi:hypothetical protein
MKESEDELTPQERNAFAALPPAQPPAFLEQKIIGQLKYAGLIRSSGLSRPAYAIGLSLACLVLGVAVGLWWGARRATTEPAQFMLMLRSSVDGPADQSPEELARVKEYSAWARKIRDAGFLVDGEKLTSETKVVELVNGKSVVSGDHLDPNEKSIGGYFLIRAGDYQQAIAIARDCPHLKYGGTIEIRRIDDVSNRRKP